MRKAGIYSAFFIAGIFVTLLISYVYSKRDIDLLSMSKEQPVIAKRDLILVVKNGRKIVLPAGTSLLFKSQYREVGTFLLEIVSTNLDDFEETEKQQIYFQKDEKKQKGPGTN